MYHEAWCMREVTDSGRMRWPMRYSKLRNIALFE
ncbi:Protein of unknown function [Pyronema omphalodes CBS 100304]|uniref:Uncharacterized protein n=1 Tax=Pyronema omphalodes (strain CBS 100304) TaxID=1076935 RepID=U4LUY9_PYROM|nr:Protein of unknown function [Pyronema omphalodes CBS 100304]